MLVLTLTLENLWIIGDTNVDGATTSKSQRFRQISKNSDSVIFRIDEKIYTASPGK
ncbi:3383_t:CDS:1, partial [Funneliformis mosseae]